MVMPGAAPGPVVAVPGLVVAVPGLGLSAAVPQRTLQRLPVPSGVVELPGFGSPARPGSPRHPADLARCLLARLDGLGMERVTLLGHSASCQVVAHAAVLAPDRVAALVLVGPTTDPDTATWPALVRRWLRNVVWERPGQAPLVLRDYRRTGLGAMARALNAARHDRIDHVLAGVASPVLVVRGAHDRICSAAWTRTLAAGTPHGTAVTLTGGAHMVPLTRPGELAATISAFLSDDGGA